MLAQKGRLPMKPAPCSPPTKLPNQPPTSSPMSATCSRVETERPTSEQVVPICCRASRWAESGPPPKSDPSSTAPDQLTRRLLGESKRENERSNQIFVEKREKKNRKEEMEKIRMATSFGTAAGRRCLPNAGGGSQRKDRGGGLGSGVAPPVARAGDTEGYQRDPLFYRTIFYRTY